MSSREVATRHVVDRCPSCGVEHDVRMNACEACDTPLRPWCRVHGGEIGWLDTPSCARCVEDAARATRPVVAPVRPPAPARAAAAEPPAPPWQPSVGSYAASLVTMLLLGGVGGGLAVLIFVLPVFAFLGGDVLVVAPGLLLGGSIAGWLFGLLGFAGYVRQVRAEAAERERSAPSSGSAR